MQADKDEQNKLLRETLSKYKEGTLSPEQVRWLFDQLKHPDSDKLLEEALRNEFLKLFPEEAAGNTEGASRQGKIFPIKKWLVAASIAALLALGVGLYWYTKPASTTAPQVSSTFRETIEPGHSQAILTLANGKKIGLDSTATGQIAVQAGTIISLDESGELNYDDNPDAGSDDATINSVATPTGGFFKIVLPDGSRVWLNSESELTFPSQFRQSERAVSLKGEGYFEVAKNPQKPFRVSLSGGETVTVLGTSFNVMAYNNEPGKKITLIEGSIRLKTNGAPGTVLIPGQQAVVTNGLVDVRSDVAIDHETAWKNGLFDFQNDDLPFVLRQISRWYNVEIVYGASSHSGHYTGAIRKSSSISEVLKMLEVAGDVNFSIVGKKIIVNDKN